MRDVENNLRMTSLTGFTCLMKSRGIFLVRFGLNDDLLLSLFCFLGERLRTIYLNQYHPNIHIMMITNGMTVTGASSWKLGGLAVLLVCLAVCPTTAAASQRPQLPQRITISPSKIEEHLYRTNDAPAALLETRGGGATPSKPLRRKAPPPAPSPAQVLADRTVAFGRELLESAVYSAIYATLALLFAGWIDVIFPAHDKAGKYTIAELMFQVVGQAAANAAVAQAVRRFVQKLPWIDTIDGSTGDKSVPAAGGGVVFAFLMFTRQSNWKAKVAALDALLDKTAFFP